MYSLPQSYNQTSKCKRCISSNAYEEKESKTEKSVKKTTSEPNSKKVEDIIDSLSWLTECISKKFAPSPTMPGFGMITRAWDKQQLIGERAEFDTKLMRLKCLDEHNKMIPYFEKKWTQPIHN